MAEKTYRSVLWKIDWTAFFVTFLKNLLIVFIASALTTFALILSHLLPNLSYYSFDIFLINFPFSQYYSPCPWYRIRLPPPEPCSMKSCGWVPVQRSCRALRWLPRFPVPEQLEPVQQVAWPRQLPILLLRNPEVAVAPSRWPAARYSIGPWNHCQMADDVIATAIAMSVEHDPGIWRLRSCIPAAEAAGRWTAGAGGQSRWVASSDSHRRPNRPRQCHWSCPAFWVAAGRVWCAARWAWPGTPGEWGIHWPTALGWPPKWRACGSPTD